MEFLKRSCTYIKDEILREFNIMINLLHYANMKDNMKTSKYERISWCFKVRVKLKLGGLQIYKNQYRFTN